MRVSAIPVPCCLYLQGVQRLRELTAAIRVARLKGSGGRTDTERVGITARAWEGVGGGPSEGRVKAVLPPAPGWDEVTSLVD